MKIGYKGFSKDLTCREQKFEIGSIYMKANLPSGKKPRLCSSEGYHYCNTLGKVFGFYRNDEFNRFCEIEVLGEYTEDYEKCVTTSFRIIREISKEEIDKVIKEEEHNKIKENLKIESLKEFQTKYPMTFIGGSTALFLHGVNLKRWRNSNNSDWDVITPYFILFQSEANGIHYTHAKKSGNDFDETFHVDLPKGEYVKMDVRIDPKTRYEIVEFDGFKFKVASLLTIVEAKMRYALQGNKKHEHDLKEMLLKK
jgi:hypothetical protein